MRIKIFLTLSMLLLLLASTLTVLSGSIVAAQQPEANLTGTIFDHGVDTNGNGLYDHLEVDVEINVTVAGNFRVIVGGLMDQSGNNIPVNFLEGSFLNVGVQYINLSVYGPMIFDSRLNPQRVSWIDLSTGDYLPLDSTYNAPLSRVYNYTEFDSPHAFLTGHISDRGIDADGDGLFDYLEVGIEINVTEAGYYQVSAQGLMENGTMTNYFYDYQYVTENFTVGVHVVYMNFSGSGIASEHLNPTDVDYIYIYDGANAVETSRLDFAALSKQYDYTLFDASSKDIQVNFKVYPDATVAVDGTLNFTHMYPENKYWPSINATLGYSTIGNLTTSTSSGTMVFPGNLDYKAIEAHLRSAYENGLLNDALNISDVLPPEATWYYPFNSTDVNLNATYSGGMFDVSITGQTIIPADLLNTQSTVFPFNMSDATVRADFDGTQLRGNITFHAVPGFPFADVTVDFSGNRSSLYFSGDLNITYASFNDFQINETTLNQKLADLTSNFTGRGPDSLYDQSSGYLECTQLNITKTPWSNPTLGAYVTYSATINGNFTGALARMMFPPGSPADQLQQLAYASLESSASSVRNASLVLSYYHGSRIAQVDLHLTSDVQALCNSLLVLVPPAIPQSMSPWSSERTQIEAWLKIANATAHVLTDASVNASYSSTDRRMSMNTRLSANVSKLKNDILPFLPDTAPPNLHDVFESFFNNMYCNTTSSTETFDMSNGTATFASTAIAQGDFEAELNQAKRFLIATMYPPPPAGLPWELRLLNETEININNLQAEFEMGQDWMHASFSGLILKPQADNIDTITFKLKKWMDLATDPNAPPLNFEKLAVTFTGASNANQTVLLNSPSDVPTPDHFSGDYRSMVWDNASLSSLKDLTFLIACENQVNYNQETYDIPILTNSTVTSFRLDPDAKQITFNVTGPPGTGSCNVTIPRTLLNASALNDWTVTFDGRALTPGSFNITGNAEYVFVYLKYTHSEHVISIKATWIVAEFQPDILPFALIIPIIIVGAIILMQRRKIRPLKTKYR